MRIERKGEKILQEDGWITYRVKGSVAYNKHVDIWHLFDLVAKKGKKTKWVQFKSGRKPTSKPFKEFASKHCCPHESVELWVHFDRKGFTVIKV